MDPCACELFLFVDFIIFCYFDTHYFLPFLLFRFLYDGARIQDDDTPASLDMEDNGVLKTLVSC